MAILSGTAEGRGCNVLQSRRRHGHTEILLGTAWRHGCFDLQAGKRSQGHMALTGEKRSGYTLAVSSSETWTDSPLLGRDLLALLD